MNRQAKKPLGRKRVATRLVGNTPLLLAVKSVPCDTKRIEGLIALGSDVDAVNFRGEFALKIALENRNFAVAALLMRSGATFNIRDHEAKSVKSFMHEVVHMSCPELIPVLLSKGVKVDVKDEMRNTPLLKALIPNDHSQSEETTVKVIEELCKFKADVNIRNKDGDAAVHLFFKYSHGAEILKALVRNGANINSKGSLDRTILHLAIKENKVDMVKEILLLGADVNVRDRFDDTPLQMAISEKALDIIQELLKKGANANETYYESKPLKEAIRCKAPLDVLNELIRHGADVNQCDFKENTIIHLLSSEIFYVKYFDKYVLKYCDNINKKNRCGETALMSAMQSMNIDVAKYLLKMGAFVNDQDSAGNSPLHHLASSESPSVEAVNILLSHGGNPALKNEKNRTALMVFIERFLSVLFPSAGRYKGNPSEKIIENLIAAFANTGRYKSSFCGSVINEQDSEGNTALHLCCADHNGFDFVPSALLHCGSDVHKRNNLQRTPLLSLDKDLIKKDTRNVLKLLLQFGADVNAKDSDGNTALLLATFACVESPCKLFLKKEKVSINVLLKYKAHINECNVTGDTALSNILLISSLSDFKKEKWGIVIKLLSHGADPNFVDKDGNTLYHVAVKDNFFGLKDLAKFGANINARTALQNAPLLHAVKIDRYEMLEHLLNNGASMDCVDDEGNTALHLMAFKPLCEIQYIKVLLAFGANVNVKNKHGHTPFSLLCLSDDSVIENFVESCFDGRCIFDMNKAVRCLLSCSKGCTDICFEHFPLSRKKPLMLSVGSCSTLNEALVKRLGKNFFVDMLREAQIYSDGPTRKEPIYLNADCVVELSKYLSVKQLLYCILAFGCNTLGISKTLENISSSDSRGSEDEHESESLSSDDL